MRNFALSILVALVIFSTPGQPDSISHNTVKLWSRKLGVELSQLGKYVTKVDKFHESYKSAKLLPHDGSDLVREITKGIKSMMDLKIAAVKRIMDVAETLAESPKTFDKPEKYYYLNAKNDTISRAYSDHFGDEVNSSTSAVHIPTNGNYNLTKVKRAVKWSKDLDHTFIDNLERDPSLSWQYFGSATGFMRQYPATMKIPKIVDLFDPRTRRWYIESATSPKDIIILVDTSGSMRGAGRLMAKHVTNNILDTLGHDDFVNVMTFSNITQSVVPCFNNTLVQATLANVRELKDGLSIVKAYGVANFSKTFNHTFELLAQFRKERVGAACNQAIMLVTDGVPYKFKNSFQFYNWNNSGNPDKADMPVRMFTYHFVGGAVNERRDIEWIACANKGYYVNLTTFAEVREKVLNYVQVMARPLVLGQKNHPVTWTSVYADMMDPKMTDYFWNQQQREEQTELVFRYRTTLKKNYYIPKPGTSIEDLHDENREYQFMISVSMPVFDRGVNGTKYGVLLGVAGTDVPIREIQKLMMPHKLGVNGYAFIVTNNGYVVIHPDHRPAFQGILKPSYNSVDLAEVELMDLGRGPREFEEGILALRDDVINQTTGSATLHTKYHYDDMDRVGRLKRKYDYRGLENTRFTVVVSLPEHGHFGHYRVYAEEEIRRITLSGKCVTDYFADNNWRIHPDWDYCKYHYDDQHEFGSPEMQLLHFLERASEPSWKWFENRQRAQSPDQDDTNPLNFDPDSPPPDKESYFCDRSLLLSLVFDAKATEWFANINITREEKGRELHQRFGPTFAFMATHSGLTRWQNFVFDDDTAQSARQFSDTQPRAIDEIWYKRAVEQNYAQPDSFVFSVPINEEGADNTTLVTASRAIFISNGKGNKAPVAVVGFQFRHTALQSLFQTITYSCEKIGNCPKDCSDESLACYLVDNHGYIVAAEDETDAGRFFGTIRGPIMTSMVDEGIFDKVRIFDYQAVCFERVPYPNSASKLSTPWKAIQKAFTWIIGQVFLTWAKMGLWSSEFAHVFAASSEEEEKSIKLSMQKAGAFINKTKPRPCDKEGYRYLLRDASAKEFNVDFISSMGCKRPYVVQPVDSTNLVLVVVYTNCFNTVNPPVSIDLEEVIYTNASLACQKSMNELRRQRPKSCMRSHPKESEIKDRCGHASSIGPNFNLLVILLLIVNLTVQRGFFGFKPFKQTYAYYDTNESYTVTE